MVGLKDFDMPSCCNSCEHWSFSRDNEPLCDLTYEDIRQFDKRQDDCPLVEAIPKAEYEARLKTDMVAMLIKLQSEIEEKKFLESSCSFMDKTEEKNYAVYTDDISDIIQQKINALTERTDDEKAYADKSGMEYADMPTMGYAT